ncbi:MAG TPA: hypothetical protein VE687_08725 [Stellaceae bacterium]|nr:hypothetical protein [Stellaceae bacterium]
MAMGEIFLEWDEFDVLAVGGMLVTTGGVVAALFPRLRRIGLLIPIAIGAAMMTVAAFGARHGDGGTGAGETAKSDQSDAIGWPPPDRYPMPV